MASYIPMRNRVTRSFRKGRIKRVQTIIRYVNDRPVCKQIIHDITAVKKKAIW